MHLLPAVLPWEGEALSVQDWPAEVQFIMSALDAAPEMQMEQRSLRRSEYRTKAYLHLFTDDPDTPPWPIYVRNINERGMGFISAERLPLGYGGIVHVAAPDGLMVKIHCTLLRCRETTPGWFDGAMYFNREQTVFRIGREDESGDFHI